jgi:hypothetical protein
MAAKIETFLVFALIGSVCSFRPSFLASSSLKLIDKRLSGISTECKKIIVTRNRAGKANIRCSVSTVQDSARTLTPGLKIFNTMSRDKEIFEPRDNGGRRVTMYTCGPTVYDFAHIGNFRAFLTYDILKRWLAYLGYDVDHVCNLTDVDDKIIQRMKRDGVTLRDLTNRYATAFLEDLRRLNILPARAYPRATDNIDAMVEMISGAPSLSCGMRTPPEKNVAACLFSLSLLTLRPLTPSSRVLSHGLCFSSCPLPFSPSCLLPFLRPS